MQSDGFEGVPIAAVEQATGIARATLRIWERRYGFPQPGRDVRGERSYPQEQVRKLRLIADLMARGHRPGRLVQLTPNELDALGRPHDDAPAAAAASLPDPVLGPLRAHDSAGVLRLFEQAIGDLGLAGFVTARMPDMNRQVGLAWSRGELQIYEEHLYTELLQQVVRAHLAHVRVAPLASRPRVLLATLPQELHGLGLLMAQVLLTLEGCACTSLGTKVPVAQIVAAAAVMEADVVGLSFTASMSPAHVLRGLEQLRAELPQRIAVWVGGSSPVPARHRIPGVRPMAHIRDVLPALSQWRADAAG